jgi:hypothetical protein
VNQNWFLDGLEDREKLPPNLPLLLDSIRPQAVLDGSFAVANAQTDEIIEITVGKPLDG